MVFITAIESKLRQSIKMLSTIIIMNILCDKDIKRDEDTQNKRDPFCTFDSHRDLSISVLHFYVDLRAIGVW